MTAQQFLRWQAYEAIEPFSGKAADLRISSVVQALYNINRDTKKKSQPFTLLEIYAHFIKEQEALSTPKKRTQTWQQQKAIFKMMADAMNAAVRQKVQA